MFLFPQFHFLEATAVISVEYILTFFFLAVNIAFMFFLVLHSSQHFQIICTGHCFH